LRERYGWVSKRYPNVPREELEDLADRWQMARQEVLSAPSSCDVQQLEHDTCGGWDDFSNIQLEEFVKALTGRNVEVVN
jgi:hypothetical protein